MFEPLKFYMYCFSLIVTDCSRYPVRMSELNSSYIYYYYYYWINNTDQSYYDDDTTYENFVTNIQKYSAIFGIILSVWTIIVNTLIIILILRDKKLKSDVFYLQIINFAVANVLIGAFVIPLTVYSILCPWKLGESVCKTWIICDVFFPFTSLLTLVILNVDRLMLLTHAKTYTCLFQQCLKPMILLAPWIISFVVIVPLWTHGSLPYELQHGECVVMLSKSVAFAGTVVTFFIPCIFVIVTTIAIVFVRLRGRRRRHLSRRHDGSLNTLMSSVESVIVESEPREKNTVKKITSDSILAIFLSDFLFCSMWFPYQCMNILISFCSVSLCMPSPLLSQIVTWAATASTCIVPLAWLADTNIRENCKTLLFGQIEQDVEEKEVRV